MKVRFDPAGRLAGELVVAADKSISHRAALIGAMCSQPVQISNYLQAADTTSTLEAVRALGAGLEMGVGEVLVHGIGLQGPREPGGPIEVGNAGTLMRLLPGWLAAQEGRSFKLDGDESIRRRPVDRVAEPLRLMGAEVATTGGRYPPLEVTGAALRSISYELPVASAQVKSCVLLAALSADGASTVGEPARSRDHSERMLLRAGAQVHRNGRHVTIESTEELSLGAIAVPGDASSAAFWLTAGALLPGARLVLKDVGVNWTRMGFLRILKRMGAEVLGELEEERGEIVASEPVSDLEVAAGSLAGTSVEPEEVPLAIDELPLVALLGCFAEGETVVRGAQELRVKESDRIETVVEGLRALGGEIEGSADGFRVGGTGGLRGGEIEAHGDHRLAMMGAIAGLASREGVVVNGMEAATVSYPDFLDDLERLTRRSA